MGKTKRQFNKIFESYKKSHKKAFLVTLELMPKNYSDELYVSSFKECFTYLYNDIEKEYLYWKSRNQKVLSHDKKSRYNFPTPSKYIVTSSYQMRKARENRRVILEDNERETRKEELLKLNSNRLLNVEKKNKRKLELIQEEIVPKHIAKYISEYFELKNRSQEVFDKKLFIIKETSKYKNKKTIDFLSKINAVEANFSLKLEAVYILQSFGEKVSLRRKPKGKLKQVSTIIPDLNETPAFLKYMIDNEQLEDYKDYDIFLSHSSFDRQEVVDFSKILNKSGLHTYVDWMNDLHFLKRALLNADTVKILLDRLNKSKALIYYHTSNSSNSYWTPWEIGYFMGLNKKLFVYNPNQLELPGYLATHETLIFREDVLFIEDTQERFEIKCLF